MPADPREPDRPAGRRAPRRPPAGLLPFDVVVERHGRGLLRFCVARLGADRGEEAFQETLLSALRGYDDLRDPEAVAGWLFAIAHRRIVDAARARERSPVPTAGLEERIVAVHHDPAPADDPWARVADLPPKQREAVGLRFLAELSHAEIGHVMATSEAAARRNVFEGLRRLRADAAR